MLSSQCVVAVMSDGEEKEKEADEGGEKAAPLQKMISVDLTLSDESDDDSPAPVPAKTNGPTPSAPSKTPGTVTTGFMSQLENILGTLCQL